MLDFLRRSRLLPLALLFVTPGVGGTVLQAAHACPVEAPWLSEPGDASNAHHHGSHGADTGAPVECHCIGACHAASTWAPPSGGPVVAIPQLTRVVSAQPSCTALAPASLPYRFLPPSTAPPLA